MLLAFDASIELAIYAVIFDWDELNPKAFKLTIYILGCLLISTKTILLEYMHCLNWCAMVGHRSSKF